MGHALLGKWQLRAVILSVTMLCFAAFVATAGAVTVDLPGSGAVVCNNGATGTAGNCTFSGNGSATYTGKVTQPAPADPSECGSQAVDEIDLLCGHFGLNFNNVSGSVTVTLTNSDPRADLTLCIADSAGVILLCATDPGSTQTITFTVGCGDTGYQALVVPSPDMSAVPPVSAIDPVVYSGGVTTSLTPCGLVGNGGGGGTKAAAGAKLTGGGQVGFASTPTGNFEVNIISTTSGFKGKVQVSSTSCSFRSDVIDVFSPEAKGASFGGWGHFKDTPNAQVRFSGQAQDNGQGDKATDPDFITVDKCSVQGQVVHGNITWHSS